MRGRTQRETAIPSLAGPPRLAGGALAAVGPVDSFCEDRDEALRAASTSGNHDVKVRLINQVSRTGKPLASLPGIDILDGKGAGVGRVDGLVGNPPTSRPDACRLPVRSRWWERAPARGLHASGTPATDPGWPMRREGRAAVPAGRYVVQSQPATGRCTMPGFQDRGRPVDRRQGEGPSPGPIDSAMAVRIHAMMATAAIDRTWPLRQRLRVLVTTVVGEE